MTEFQPQTNKQAYLAYAVGLITDPELLPEPRTNEEVLLREYCLNGSGGGEGGVTLPTLSNPATVAQLLLGYEAIDQNGEKMTGTYEPLVLPELDAPAEVEQILEGFQALDEKGRIIYGMMEDNSGRWYSAAVDLETGTVNVPRGFHDGITGVQIEVEEQIVTPSDAKQEIVPSRGAVLGKVIVCPAEGSGDGGSGIKIANVEYLFYNDCRTDIVQDLLPLCVGITSTRHMFESCQTLKGVDLSTLDTSEVTTMTSMFDGCSGLVSLDMSVLDTSKVNQMDNLFEGCMYLATIVFGGKFDTSQVSTMDSMFAGCQAFTDVDLTSFDVGNVRSMYLMFYNCRSMKSLDLTGWNTGNVLKFERMFDCCESLESLDVSHFDTSSATTMATMFSGCAALTALNVSDWDTSKVTSMASMFKGCGNLASLDVSNFNTSKVTTVNYMFYNCSSLKSLNFSNWDTKLITNMSNMFSGATSLEEIIGFSATNKAGLTIAFPIGTAGTESALRRLTFRTDLPEGTYSIRSAINVRYCDLYREGLVEMFNTLPDVSGLSLSNSQKTIYITGNPGVEGRMVIPAHTHDEIATVEELSTLCDTCRIHAAQCTFTDGNGEEKTMMPYLIVEGTETVTFPLRNFYHESVTAYGVNAITDEDRAIATTKGWILTE